MGPDDSLATERAAKELMAQLNSGIAHTKSQHSGLSPILSHLESLKTDLRSIEKVGVFLKSTVYGFAIESVRSENSIQTFASFVEDLRNLSGRLNSHVETLLSRVAATAEDQRAALNSIESEIGNLETLSHSVSKAADTANDNTRAIVSKTLKSLQQSRQYAKTMTERADDVVYQLQFGDILRQKFEHISSALEDALDLVQPTDQTGEGPSQEKRGIAATQLLSIQQEQLKETRHEISETKKRTARSFDEISEATRLLNDFLHSEHDEIENSTIAPLNTALHALHDLSGKADSAATQVSALTGQIANDCSELSRQLQNIRTINNELHLQALNATVKAAALKEEGSTLEILSMQIHGLFQSVNTTSESIGSTVDRIIELSQRVAEPAAGEGENSVEHKDVLAIGTLITDAYRDLQTLPSELSELMSDQSRSLSESRERFKFLDDTIAEIDLQIQELQSLTANHSEQSDDPEIRALLDTMGNRYTMEGERLVHSRSMIAPAVPPISSTSDLSAPGIEYFAIDQTSSAQSPDSLSRDSLDLPARKSTVSESSNPSEEFGDNVELF